jgi:hypothetical protein
LSADSVDSDSDPDSESDRIPSKAAIRGHRRMQYDSANIEPRSAPDMKPRSEHEPPACIAEWGWRYHHIGIPTDTPREREVYLEKYRMYVSGFDTSPYGVEWMRFEAESPISELVRTVPHIAFEVDDLDRALEGKELIDEPSSPMTGVRVAMILHNGMPVELLEFSKP